MRLELHCLVWGPAAGLVMLAWATTPPASSADAARPLIALTAPATHTARRWLPWDTLPPTLPEIEASASSLFNLSPASKVASSPVRSKDTGPVLKGVVGTAAGLRAVIQFGGERSTYRILGPGEVAEGFTVTAVGPDRVDLREVSGYRTQFLYLRGEGESQ